MSKLMLHCGAEAVERDELRNAVTPPATETHFPIPHHMLVDQIQRHLQGVGWQVDEEHHGLTKDGDRYFGVFELSKPRPKGGDGTALAPANPDWTICCGIRNSHDKSFAAQMAAGSRVFVCDNLAFSGTVKLARKHTRHIVRDLSRFTHRAITRIGEQFTRQEDQIAAYKGTTITDKDAALLVVDGVKRGVLPNQVVTAVFDEWREPTHECFEERTLWSLFNAVTEIGKEKKWSADILERRTKLLHGLMDSAAGIADDRIVDAQGFEVVSEEETVVA